MHRTINQLYWTQCLSNDNHANLIFCSIFHTKASFVNYSKSGSVDIAQKSIKFDEMIITVTIVTCHEHHHLESRSELLDGTQSNLVDACARPRHNAICYSMLEHAWHISSLPYFHLCTAHRTQVRDYLSMERIDTWGTRLWIGPDVLASTHRIFLTVRRLEVSNLFLCIFLLFAVRIVASLGAVCMRSEKNYVRDRADPL